MRKSLVEKRISKFKESFPEFKVSKKGNFIFEKNKREETREVHYRGYNITKGLFKKVGTKDVIRRQVCEHVYLITTTGKLMIKSGHDKYFKNVTLKDINWKNCRDLKDTFFIGRKYEYLKHCHYLHHYRIFQNFNSLKEAKLFFGFEFISDVKFYKMFEQVGKASDIISEMLDVVYYISFCKSKEDKVNLCKLLTNKEFDKLAIELEDYIKLCIDRNVAPVIPGGKNKLKELHDNLVMEANKENADCYSKEQKYESLDSEFTKKWDEIGLEYRRLNTPYDMFLKGCQQKHCIGVNYYSNLDKYSFYTIGWKGTSYELQIGLNGVFVQFKGKRNSNPPEELTKLIKSKLINYKHTITKVENFLHDDKYPLIKEPVGTGMDLWF